MGDGTETEGGSEEAAAKRICAHINTGLFEGQQNPLIKCLGLPGPKFSEAYHFLRYDFSFRDLFLFSYGLEASRPFDSNRVRHWQWRPLGALTRLASRRVCTPKTGATFEVAPGPILRSKAG